MAEVGGKIAILTQKYNYITKSACLTTFPCPPNISDQERSGVNHCSSLTRDLREGPALLQATSWCGYRSWPWGLFLRSTLNQADSLHSGERTRPLVCRSTNDSREGQSGTGECLCCRGRCPTPRVPAWDPNNADLFHECPPRMLRFPGRNPSW